MPTLRSALGPQKKLPSPVLSFAIAQLGDIQVLHFPLFFLLKVNTKCSEIALSPNFKDLVLNKDLFGTLGPYRVLIYISGSLFSLFWFHSRKECQFRLHVYNNGSGLNCWQILIFTYAYALIFIHRRFGSLFWLLGVLIGSLFHKKMGPYLRAWGSLLVLEAVVLSHTYFLT